MIGKSYPGEMDIEQKKYLQILRLQYQLDTPHKQYLMNVYQDAFQIFLVIQKLNHI